MCCEHSLYTLNSLQCPAFCIVDRKNDARTQRKAERFLRIVCNPRRFKVVQSQALSEPARKKNPLRWGIVFLWWHRRRQGINSPYSTSRCLRSCKQPAGRRELLLGVSTPSLTSFSLPFSAECCGGRGDRHRCCWLQATPLFNTPSPNRMQPSCGHRPAHPLPLSYVRLRTTCLGFVWRGLV